MLRTARAGLDLEDVLLQNPAPSMAHTLFAGFFRPVSSLRSLCVFPLVFLLGGCAVVQVNIGPTSAATNRREALTLVRANGNAPAAALLLRAQESGLGRDGKLAALLEAARLTANAQPGDPALEINRSATTQIVDVLKEARFQSELVKITPASRETLDPSTVERLLPARSVAIRGLRGRTVQEGVGVAMVAWLPRTSPAFRGQPAEKQPGLSIPVTAHVTFPKSGPEITFYRTLRRDSVRLGGRSQPLDADFSAPLAYLLSQGKNRSIDLQALLFTDRNIAHAGLAQFEEYDPQKIPVVFVHGLMSRPEAWTQAANELMADPEIRKRYQFWFYLYPTGLPVWWSAAKLRSELDRFRLELDPRHANPNLDRLVVVGHSMGGLISSLLIREGGEKLWRQFSDTSPEDFKLSPAGRKHIRQLVDFQPRSDVGRVIFVATPHRGSELAMNPVASFFSSLVRLPFTPLERDRYLMLQFIRSDLRSLFVVPANSIQFLRARSPLLLAILALPLSPQAPYHSIIGDRGKGDAPHSSDGVVPYWSSHMTGAASEKIVPSSHGANEHPAGIEEIRRVLHVDLETK
jgi:pimeloyl-ACP methyl ester carboxylesterase